MSQEGCGQIYGDDDAVIHRCIARCFEEGRSLQPALAASMLLAERKSKHGAAKWKKEAEKKKVMVVSWGHRH
jgi:hypothetical protein